MNQTKPVRVAIAGLGSRGLDTYAAYAKIFPDKMRITAVAEPRQERLLAAAAAYDVPSDLCFATAEEMLECEKLADVMFICTQDRQHYAQAAAAIKKGYHLLLEKPVSPDNSECAEIARLAKEYKRLVTVCHVLRYTPFYRELKRLLDAGTIGEVVTVQAIENVQYWHQAHSFVRGNWAREEETSPMILQKCCHDMDILLWLTGKRSRYVSSYGSLFHFRPENAPHNAALRCLDCVAGDTCPYNAVKIYLTNERTGVLHGKTDWPANVLALRPDEDSIRRALREGPYGICVYKAGNDVVDHQVVNIELEDGSTVNFTMSAFTSRGGRTLKIMGTMGDIQADMETNLIDVGVFGKEHEIIDVNKLADDFSGHGGGDIRMVEELLDQVASGAEPGTGLTSIDRSVESHYLAMAAEYSRLHHGQSVSMEEWRQRLMS
ncbi:Gfo/Idh/MocA family protein [Lachnotalea sp. AF33-28]|uniref:Gfo/Idh/MocA family protein n=1 Tax=Lachnotalea sp. AF33-28 TaxID=2292046 RepID=UPI000E5098E5|nr:Gfo/Idh/MocA family oxidoreductase [Lachnotalea sp. AF33-28]RHP33952.1 gfo/Idh/MocA family oxidoreductase [Lachnotalea sp. AF33-28]